jgi:hypothetical protein
VKPARRVNHVNPALQGQKEKPARHVRPALRARKAKLVRHANHGPKEKPVSLVPTASVAAAAVVATVIVGRNRKAPMQPVHQQFLLLSSY